MKAKELHELTVDELNTKLKELSEELFNLRFRHAIGQLESPASLGACKKEIAYINPKSNIFYKGEYFESNLFVKNIVNDAKDELIVIDPYFEEKSLNNLKIKKNIKCLIITSSKNKLSNSLINCFSKEYFPISIKICDDFHDRFLIVDNETIYHIGTSFNYLGNKTFIINKINDAVWREDFLKRLKNYD